MSFDIWEPSEFEHCLSAVWRVVLCELHSFLVKLIVYDDVSLCHAKQLNIIIIFMTYRIRFMTLEMTVFFISVCVTYTKDMCFCDRTKPPTHSAQRTTKLK